MPYTDQHYQWLLKYECLSAAFLVRRQNISMQSAMEILEDMVKDLKFVTYTTPDKVQIALDTWKRPARKQRKSKWKDPTTTCKILKFNNL